MEALNESKTLEPIDFKMREYKSTKILANGSVVTYNYKRAVPIMPKKSRKKEYTKAILANLARELSAEQLRDVIDYVRATLARGVSPPESEAPTEVAESENRDS